MSYLLNLGLIDFYNSGEKFIGIEGRSRSEVQNTSFLMIEHSVENDGDLEVPLRLPQKLSGFFSHKKKRKPFEVVCELSC